MQCPLCPLLAIRMAGGGGHSKKIMCVVYDLHIITPRRACAARGKVIALGLDINMLMSTKKFQNSLKSILTQEGFSSNLIASSIGGFLHLSKKRRMQGMCRHRLYTTHNWDWMCIRRDNRFSSVRLMTTLRPLQIDFLFPVHS